MVKYLTHFVRPGFDELGHPLKNVIFFNFQMEEVPEIVHKNYSFDFLSWRPRPNFYITGTFFFFHNDFKRVFKRILEKDIV